MRLFQNFSAVRVVNFALLSDMNVFMTNLLCCRFYLYVLYILTVPDNIMSCPCPGG